jgi:hypothetical protein
MKIMQTKDIYDGTNKTVVLGKKYDLRLQKFLVL